MERLTERVNDRLIMMKQDSGDNASYYWDEGNFKVAEKLATYEDLEEQGLLVRLPCKEVYSKSGDEVYLIFEDEIIECIHCGLDICGSDGEGYIILGAYEDIFPYRDPDPEYDLDPADWCRNTNHVSLSEIGKTLFFTREEAEKKLKELENE